MLVTMLFAEILGPVVRSLEILLCTDINHECVIHVFRVCNDIMYILWD